MKMSQGQLPKSTTCCWSLRRNNEDYVMKQYFVGVDLKFGYDISSNKLKNKNNVGATFLSSLFHHCTTIPIWIDKNNKIHLTGPDRMYNFAWGGDGGNENNKK